MTPTKQAEKVQDESVLLAAEAVESEEAEIVALIERADWLTIETPKELEASTGFLQTIKARQKVLTDLRLSITRPMDEAKKQVIALFQPAVEQLATAEEKIKAAVLAYTQEQRRLQAEAQIQLDTEARREQLRLKTLAEKQRVAGRDDRAEATEERAVEVQAPTVAVAEAPTGAVHVRTTWRAEVTDLAELARACADGKQPIGLLQPDMAVLNQIARTLKHQLDIPGVKAVSEEGVSARAG